MTKAEIKKKIKLLEKELLAHKRLLEQEDVERPQTVMVPDHFSDLFGAIEEKVDKHFDDFYFDPISGEITVQGERYVLFRSASMSYEFLDFIKERYSDRKESEAVSIGNNFLYDNAKVIGKNDANAFHPNLDLKDPVEKLSAGPVYFAYTGWANVEIFPESNPVADESYMLKFQHHNSFEAQSWIKAKKKSAIPVCTMNCGYSAGWCEESFGIPLTTVEISCEAQGADACTFIMAPPDKIEQYVEEVIDLESVEDFEIPVFFKRKNIEEQLKQSISQKELLIKEIHHRVKNNLQVISSLLSLQMSKRANLNFQEEFQTSINRVRTMATVHELLYQQKNFENFKMNSYFSELGKSLINTYSVNEDVEVEIRIDSTDQSLSLERSIPVALIMNEITCNSFKHGLTEGGKFYIYLNDKDDQYVLTIGDNGGGFTPTDKNDGLGLSLIDILCDQLDATKELKNSSKGLEYTITFDK